MTHPSPRTSRGLLLGLGAAASLVAAMPLVGAAAAEPPHGLTIEISDAVDEVAAGDALSVEATLTNAGTDDVEAVLVITAPPSTSFSAAEGADVTGADARWNVTVAAGESATVTAGVDVADIPESAYQLATLASVYVDDESTPVIRAADVDTVPERTNPVAPAVAEAAASDPDTSTVVLVGGAAAVVVAAAAAVSVPLIRRRRASRTR